MSEQYESLGTACNLIPPETQLVMKGRNPTYQY